MEIFGNNILDESVQVISLLDIVKDFDLLAWTGILGRVQNVQSICQSMRGKPVVAPPDWKLFINLAHEVATESTKCRFNKAKLKAENLARRLQVLPENFDFSALEAEFRNVQDDVTLEMSLAKFIQLENDAWKYASNENLLGVSVLASFPETRDDIISAGNCISINLGTAAVFHLMRIVESGLRAFARHLGVIKVRANYKKANKLIPLEFAEWEKILRDISEKIDAKLLAMKRGPKKQEAQEFYYSALKELSGFKDAWRNHVMHVRKTYNAKDAIAILSHVERFMDSLAKKNIGNKPHAQKP